jgi:DNA-binding response OmpR family regulator
MATILVLDGDETTLRCLSDVLEAFGHTVLPTRTQEAAMAVARGLTFDLFLVDVELEDLDVPTLVSTLVASSPQGVLVAVSDYPKAQRTLQALDAGATCLMRKPFEIGKILKLLGGTCA